MLDNLLLLLKLLLIDIVLSGDNAVVIAMASRNLPDHLRKRAIWLGALGAVGLRIVLAVAALALLDIPAVKIVGSLLLLYIAYHLLVEDGDDKEVKGAASLGKAVGIIMVSDLVMSLDNVVAVASVANNNIWLMALGIALSIPLIIWGSQLIMKLLTRFPIVVWIGSAILGYTAGEMLEGVEAVQERLPEMGDWGHVWLPVATAILVLLAGLVHRMIASRGKEKREGDRARAEGSNG
ncbi:TerC family protein [Cohnella lubricantis]|uniref:TerC family protein n=1 Tax=Cohnella lubricantis TaxID=2163172 RepID=A0A841TCG4_9BACL|nr:TerC family protein [Cohnella lubricantis]MBB6676930.1 TerC family protein [Cohnella lubricantis]MBP2118334.1 YjbE family integral membrane protein [Cohnella lubricantis]